VSNEFKKKLDKLKRKQSETAIKFINTNQNKISAGLGLKISMDFIVSIVVGVLIGLGLDKIFSSNPVFFIIFLLLGVIAGFLNLYRTVIKIENKK
tara:strand:+ start:2143 stop:2427 length:285 start_codon:yes stop_codon:yes gene_type:complete